MNFWMILAIVILVAIIAVLEIQYGDYKRMLYVGMGLCAVYFGAKHYMNIRAN